MKKEKTSQATGNYQSDPDKIERDVYDDPPQPPKKKEEKKEEKKEDK